MKNDCEALKVCALCADYRDNGDVVYDESICCNRSSKRYRRVGSEFDGCELWQPNKAILRRINDAGNEGDE